MCVAGSGQALPPLSSRPAVADWRQFPLFFGTTVYCFEAISLVSVHQGGLKILNKSRAPCDLLHVRVARLSLHLMPLNVTEVSGMRLGDRQFTFT